jgi:hypothetical protein
MKNGQEGAFASMNEYERQEGLTKREYFAAMAMQGLLSSNTASMSRGIIDVQAFACTSVQMADLILEELEKTEKQ